VILLAKCQRDLLLLFSLEFVRWRGFGAPLAWLWLWLACRTAFPADFTRICFRWVWSGPIIGANARLRAFLVACSWSMAGVSQKLC